MLTKLEAWEQTKPDGATCDFALPQNWLEQSAVDLHLATGDTVANCYQRIRGQVVWMYREGQIFGWPFGITPDGQKVVALLS